MTRYFYDCQLKAAFMAKYFGMRFMDVDYSYGYEGAIKQLYDHDGDVIPMNDTVRDYIHPDSLHLLEPMEGDMVMELFNDKLGWRQFYIDLNHEQHPVKPYRIIQRNGTAFHWPDSEE